MSQLIGREHSRRIAWQQSRNMVHTGFLVYRNCLIFAVALMTACCKTSKNTRYCMRLSRIVRQPWSLSILLSLQFVDLSLTRKKASLSMVLKTLIVLENVWFSFRLMCCHATDDSVHPISHDCAPWQNPSLTRSNTNNGGRIRKPKARRCAQFETNFTKAT